MGFAIATFVICLGAVLGVYWALIVRPETRQCPRGHQPPRPVRSADGALEHRRDLRGCRQRPAGSASARSDAPPSSGLHPDHRPVHSRSRHGGHRRRLPALLAAAASLIGGAVWYTWTRVLPLAVIMALIGGLMPYLVVRRRRAKRLQLFEEQFPEAIDLMARALRAGHAFTTGLGIAADELPAPVGTEFKRVYDQQNFGHVDARGPAGDGPSGPGPRRPVLRHRSADAARIGRQPGRGARQPLVGDARSLQGASGRFA